MIKKILNNITLISSSLYFFFLLKINKLVSSEYEFYLLDKIVKNNDIVIDIGSNIGRYSFKLSKLVGSKGMVYSFEPMIKSYIIQSLLIFFSGIKNILLINMACSNSNEKVLMQEKSSKNKNYLFNTNTESSIVKKKNEKTYFK